MQNTRIGIVCANDLVRESLRSVLAARMLQVHVTGATVLDLCGLDDDVPLDVIIIVSEADKIESAQWRQAKMTFPSARLALTIDRFNIDFVTKAFEQGVDGVVVGDMSCDQVAVSLKLIALGERVIPSRVLDYLLAPRPARIESQAGMSDIVSDLSARELEILQCLVCGEANKVIARRLEITETMVKLHIKTILRKLNVANRTQAAIWAVVRGINRIEMVSSRSAS